MQNKEHAIFSKYQRTQARGDALLGERISREKICTNKKEEKIMKKSIALFLLLALLLTACAPAATPTEPPTQPSTEAPTRMLPPNRPPSLCRRA